MARVDLSKAIMETHNNLTCVICGSTLKSSTNYYPSFSRNAITRADDKRVTRMIVCKECAQNLFNYLYEMFRDVKKAARQFCAGLDIYYDEEILLKLEGVDTGVFVKEYFKLLDSNIAYSGKTFIDSVITQDDSVAVNTTKTSELSDEDAKNRREIISVFHYDPFENETTEERKKLYRDLVTMADPAMTDDLVRQRAAIEIVRSFARIDKLTETINELSNDPQRMMVNSKQIKDLVAIKNQETDMVTKFSKDHGFAERYATAKSRGTGTLSATIRDMEEYDYDNGKVNLYDIKTSATMQQAAEISTNAIMKQLNLSEADYADMLKQQRERIVYLESEVARKTEEARLIYTTITKQELLKELMDELIKKGMPMDEVNAAILAEIHYDDKLLLEAKVKYDKAQEKKK